MRGAYIAAVARPDLTFGFAVSSQVVSPNAESIKFLNNVIRTSEDTVDLSLQFVPSDHISVKLAVFSNASFAF